MEKLFLLGMFPILIVSLGTYAGDSALIGGGMGISTGAGTYDLEIAEAFGQFPLEAPLSLEFLVAYLPPLLPGENSVTAWLCSLDYAGGPLVLGLGGGVLWEGGPLTPLSPLVGGSARLRLALGEHFGLYAQIHLIFAYKNGPEKGYIYGYAPWSAGIYLMLPSADRGHHEPGAE